MKIEISTKQFIDTIGVIILSGLLIFSLVKIMQLNDKLTEVEKRIELAERISKAETNINEIVKFINNNSQNAKE